MSPLLLALAVQIQTPAAPPATCTIARAERVRFEEVHRDLARLRGRCIAVRGIAAGRALYRDEASSRAPRTDADAATAARRIGLNGGAAIEDGRIQPDAYVAVGLLGDCGNFRRGDGVAPRYCHDNEGGPVLIVTDLRRRNWPGPRGIW